MTSDTDMNGSKETENHPVGEGELSQETNQKANKSHLPKRHRYPLKQITILAAVVIGILLLLVTYLFGSLPTAAQYWYSYLIHKKYDQVSFAPTTYTENNRPLSKQNTPRPTSAISHRLSQRKSNIKLYNLDENNYIHLFDISTIPTRHRVTGFPILDETTNSFFYGDNQGVWQTFPESDQTPTQLYQSQERFYISHLAGPFDNTIYFVESFEDIIAKNPSPAYIKSINLETGKTQQIFQGENPLYFGYHYIAPTDYGHLIRTEGGDGCGGGGEYFLINQGVSQEIIAFGYGCSSAPRPIGENLDKNFIYLATIDEKRNVGFNDYANDHIIRVNIADVSQEELIDLSSHYSNDVEFLAQKGQFVSVDDKGIIYRYSKDTGELLQSIPTNLGRVESIMRSGENQEERYFFRQKHDETLILTKLTEAGTQSWEITDSGQVIPFTQPEKPAELSGARTKTIGKWNNLPLVAAVY